MPVKIFCCYAHEDEPLLKKLKAHLRPLQRQGLVDVWHDRDISAGAEWEQEIKEQLDAAQIILLLVSPDFINSDYCYGVEMQRAIDRHQSKEARVIPIILRPVYWQVEPLSRLQALPIDGIPITDPSWHNVDRAFFKVTEGIIKVVEELNPYPPVNVPVKSVEIPKPARTKSTPSTGIEPKMPTSPLKPVNTNQPQTHSPSISNISSPIMSLSAPCRQRGQSCTFFDLEYVEYSELHCRLTGKTYEIIFFIRGLRPPDRSNLHKYRAEVTEQGNPSFAQFAEKTKRKFLSRYSKVNGDIDTSGSAQITFLVKRNKIVLSGQRGIVVNCRFSHGTDLNIDNWCDKHQVSIILIVVGND